MCPIILRNIFAHTASTDFMHGSDFALHRWCMWITRVQTTTGLARSITLTNDEKNCEIWDSSLVSWVDWPFLSLWYKWCNLHQLIRIISIVYCCDQVPKMKQDLKHVSAYGELQYLSPNMYQAQYCWLDVALSSKYQCTVSSLLLIYTPIWQLGGSPKWHNGLFLSDWQLMYLRRSDLQCTMNKLSN